MLENILPSDQILTDATSLETYGKDWTKHFKPKAKAIVFPKSHQDIEKLVSWAKENKTALVPSGGRTGLSGAAIALNEEVVVSFDKMNKILDFSETDMTVTCQPGTVTEDLQKFVEEKGYYFPIDFAARGSSQIGGNVSTNAGGIKVIKYGLMRNWVSSLKVVTGSGQTLNLNNSLVKNASGYDLRQLFIGAEGTLGLISEISLKVTTQPKELTVFLLGVSSLESVMNIYNKYKAQVSIEAYEMFTELAMEYVTGQGHVSRPFETKSPYYVLIEIENDSSESLDKAIKLFEDCMEQGWVEDGTISQSPQQARNLWRLREDITEATSHKSPYKNDVSVKVSLVPQFLEEVDGTLKKEYPEYDVVWFGHIGDGNLHINILKPDETAEEEFVKNCQEASHILFKVIEKLQGSISAEHGVGLTKKPYLKYTRSPEEVEIMRSIKKVFDPENIMNPGKIF